MRRDGFFVEVSELGMFKFSFFERKVVLNADKDPPPVGREKDLQNCRRMWIAFPKSLAGPLWVCRIKGLLVSISSIDSSDLFLKEN